MVSLAFIMAGLCAAAPRHEAAPQKALHKPPAARRAAHPKPTSTPDPVFGQLKWREIGPALAGGRVAAVAGTASDASLYYLGSAGGGVWKSDDGGTTWNAVFGRQPVAAIGAVEIDPTNKDIVWVGTGEANPRNDVSYGDGIYKSVDGGKTWKDVGLRGVRHIARIAINPRDHNVVIVAAFGDFFRDTTSGGVWRTADGGRSWRHTLYVGPQSGGSDLAMDPKDPNIIFAGIWQFRRLPWTFTSGGPDDGLYRSTDGGTSWTKLRGHGLPSGLMGRIGVAIAPSSPRRVFATIQSKAGVLWRSDDGGDTWRLMSDDTIINQRPFYFSHLAVDPANPNHLFGVSELLTQSKDGGKTFKAIADEVHVDYHAIWIAPNNAKRMIVGEDGGYALSLNGGGSWSFAQNLAIGQAYHVGVDDRNPYWVCAPLQDNNGFCGPSNSLSPDGILNSAWRRVTGGDGMWALPDPADPQRVWTDSQEGSLQIYDYRSGLSRPIRPVYYPSDVDFNLYRQQYRFNWDSPIAFAPWDPHTVWLGSDVVFQSTDDGAHWQAISPDLTRDIKAHQRPGGGAITLDVSSAEFSDTLLDIEASPLARGEIWAGTDDGLVQLTRDGTHWKDVTPPGAPRYGRVETVAPSPLVAGTAYAVFDDHRSGNYQPYIFVTRDFGEHWRKITSGLPVDQYVRTVRPDIHNSQLLYAGTEEGMWVSFDGGRRWHSLQLNLPSVSVRDVRLQPTFDDIVIATHGRAVWIFDDVRPLQELVTARAASAALFQPRPAYEYHQHSDIEDTYEDYAAANPPRGVIITFYQATPQKSPPTIQVLNAQGTVVRTLSGTHKVKGKDVPYVSNDRSLNRVVWDFHESGPSRWLGAPNEDARGPTSGALVPPGVYTIRLRLGGRSFTRTVEVRPDPRLTFSQADYQAGYAFAHHHFAEYSNVDIALNALDAFKKAASRLRSSRRLRATPAIAARLDDLLRMHDTLFGRLTANFRNDEDSITRPGALREDLADFQELNGAPTEAFLRYAAVVDERYWSAMRAYEGFTRSVRVLNALLRGAGQPALPEPRAITES